MSYDIDLLDPYLGQVIEVKEKHNIAGGTYEVGGSTSLSFNITWNYASNLVKALGSQGIRTIYGMTGAESIPVLDAGIAKLNDYTSDDYWENAEGNVKRALQGLKSLAILGPTGIWDGD